MSHPVSPPAHLPGLKAENSLAFDNITNFNPQPSWSTPTDTSHRTSRGSGFNTRSSVPRSPMNPLFRSPSRDGVQQFDEPTERDEDDESESYLQRCIPQHLGELPESVLIRRVIGCSCSAVVPLACIAGAITAESFSPYIAAAAGSFALLGVASVVCVLQMRNVSSVAAELFAYTFAAAAILLDFGATQKGGALQHLWWGVLLAADILFLTNAKVRALCVVMGCAAVWVVAGHAETALHVGMLRFDSGVCDCDDPPCVPHLRSAMSALVPLVVLIFDCAAKKLMSDRYHKSLRAPVNPPNRGPTADELLHDTVTLVNALAVCVSVFDLDAADAMLGPSSRVPDALQHALHEIVGHLRKYKAYIPNAHVPVPLAETMQLPNGLLLLSELFANANIADAVCDDMENADSHRNSSKSNPFGTPLRGTSTELSRESTSEVWDRSSIGGRSQRSVHSAAHVANKLLAVQRREMKLRYSSISLVVTNLAGTLGSRNGLLGGALDDLREVGYASVEESVGRHLKAAISAFQPRKGVIDLFLGDRVYASFNASRPCVSHAVAAMSSAKEFVKSQISLECNAAIASGKVLCGDVGCEDMRRYTMFGKLPLTVAALERAGRALGIRLVTDNPTQKDVFVENELRLFPRKLSVMKYGKDHPAASGDLERSVGAGMSPVSSPILPPTAGNLTRIPSRIVRRGHSHAASSSMLQLQGTEIHSTLLWEAVLTQDDAQAGDPRTRRRNTEWMYELEAASGADWTKYNSAMKKFLHGETITTVLEALTNNNDLSLKVQNALEDATAGSEPFIIWA